MSTGTSHLSEKLIEKAEAALKEECACHAETKTDLQKALDANAALQAANDEMLKKIEELEAGIQENARKDAVRKIAGENKVKLSESDVTRYSKFTDEELKDQIAKDGKLQESSGGVASPPTGSEFDDSEGSADWMDDVPELGGFSF